MSRVFDSHAKVLPPGKLAALIKPSAGPKLEYSQLQSMHIVSRVIPDASNTTAVANTSGMKYNQIQG